MISVVTNILEMGNQSGKEIDPTGGNSGSYAQYSAPKKGSNDTKVPKQNGTAIPVEGSATPGKKTGFASAETAKEIKPGVGADKANASAGGSGSTVGVGPTKVGVPNIPPSR